MIFKYLKRSYIILNIISENIKYKKLKKYNFIFCFFLNINIYITIMYFDARLH